MDELTKREEEKLLKDSVNSEVIEKAMSFSWDGKNLVVRFPRDVAQYLKVTEKNRKEKKLLFRIVEQNNEVTKTFEVIEKDD